MKKNISLILITLLCIFFNIKVANANVEYNNDVCTAEDLNYGDPLKERGRFSYDIDNFEVINNNLIITGWGRLNASDGVNKIHNIEPEFTLKLEYYNENKFITSTNYGYVNKVNHRSYSSADAKPNDFSVAVYNAFVNEICPPRPNGDFKQYYFHYFGRERSSNNCGLGNYYQPPDWSTPYRNKLYINLDFKFIIPIKDITDLQERYVNTPNNIPNKVYFRMQMKQDAKIETVYGNSITTEARQEACIPLSIAENVIKKESLESKKLYIEGIYDKRTEVNIAVTNGVANPSPTTTGTQWAYVNKSSSAELVEKRQFPTGPNYKVGGIYSVIDLPLGTYNRVNHGLLTQLTTYPVLIKREYNSLKKEYTDFLEDANAEDANSYVAYVLSFWTKPYIKDGDRGTYLLLETDRLEKTCETCKTNWEPHCNDLDLNCCHELCDFTSSDDSYEVNIDANEDICRTNCCSVEYPGSKEQLSCCETSNSAPICKISSKLPSDCDDEDPQISRIEKVENTSLNKYCNVSCKETTLLLIEPKVTVKAGMGFNYPLYVSVESNCTVNFNYNLYDTDIRSAVSSLNYNRINSIKNLKNDCFNYFDNKQINPSGEVTLNIETSKDTISEKLEYKENSREVYKQSNELASYYCGLDDITYSPSSKPPVCSNENNVNYISGNVSVNGYYTLKDRIVELYSGKIVDKMEEGKTINLGDKFYTSFYEITDEYEMNLVIENIGKYKTGDEAGIIGCTYSLDNSIFPQEDDINYSKYGSLGYMFRVVDVVEPFPSREPRENWKFTDESVIREYEGTIYRISLNPKNRKTILEYNRSNEKYDSFINIVNGKSAFINDNDDIFKIENK